ncbi:MAG: lysyl oxidase family protein [Bacteroidota bacterium]
MIQNASVKIFLGVLLLCALFALHSCNEKVPVSPVENPERNIVFEKNALSTMSAADLWIYDDALVPPWINASWSASVTFNSTEQVRSGSSSIKVVLSSAWGALSLHYGNWYSSGITPSEYQSLDVAVYAVSNGTSLNIFAENDQGESFPTISYGTIAPNQWTIISVPTTQLSPNGQIINRVALQEVSGAAKTFYVDDFRFTGGQPTGTPPVPPVLVSPTNNATDVETNPTLVWNASAEASSYRVQVSTSQTFATTIADQSNITATSYALNNVSYSTTYYWRVNAANTAGTSGWSETWNFTTVAAPPSQYAPDLTVDANALRSSIQIRWKTLSSSSCAVVEGCASPGRRKLLRFTVIIPNYGTADLFFGNPADTPQLFDWSPCHGHYHFKQFAEYRLLTANNAQLVVGRKQAFCLLDSKQYWSGYPSRGYSCDYQGISVGWGDVYDRSIDCQWLDITGIAAGSYTLEVEVNAGGVINEGQNQWTNVVRVPVSIQ